VNYIFDTLYYGVKMENFANIIVNNGGSIKPLIINSNQTNGTGLFNPSVYVDDDKIYINIRHCQYTLYHSENNLYEHPYGPLVYFNPENDITLTTTNYFGELNDNLDLKYVHKVDTSKLDIKPVWEFIGLEDARIVKWDNKFYLCGVRRDTKPNGEGRMELSELEVTNNHVKEVSRFRIPAPHPNDSYCEKNWMPIIDKPFHFLKWSNPVQIVKVDPEKNSCETVFLSNDRHFQIDQRGGGQVIPYKDGYLSLIHETSLYETESGKKNGTYRHRFIHWNKDWVPVRVSPIFNFMNAKIEFAAGLARMKDGSILITFGFQDNAAYILRCPEKVLEDVLNNEY